MTISQTRLRVLPLVTGAGFDRFLLLNAVLATSFLLSCALQAQPANQPGALAFWGANGYGQAWVPQDLGNVKAVRVSSRNALALFEDGTLRAWGSEANDALNIPEAATNIVDISISATHILALRQDGRVFVWGGSGFDTNLNNLAYNMGQIAAGNGFTVGVEKTGSKSLVQSGRSIGIRPIIYDPKAISAGIGHAVALLNNGTVVAWGELTVMYEPPADLTNVAAVAAGGLHTIALTSNNTVRVWGRGAATNVPPDLTNVIAIAAGGNHCMALKSDGTLAIWGEEWFGEIKVPEGLTNMLAVAAGGSISAAIAEPGFPVIAKQPKSRSVLAGTSLTLGVSAVGESPLSYQWSRDGNQLLNETNSTFTLPSVTSTEVGEYQLVVTNSIGSVTSEVVRVTLGNVIGWGVNTFERTEAPAGATNVVQVAGGLSYSAFLRADGRLEQTGAIHPAPEDLTNVFSIAASDGSALAVRSNGLVSGWGFDSQGETQPPAEVTDIAAVAAGAGGHTLGLKSDGTVVAWGNPGPQTEVPEGLAEVIRISAGYLHSIALRSDGTLTGWGDDFGGALDISVGLSNVVEISAFGTANYALRSDGTVTNWGTFSQPPPAGLSNVVAISCGVANALALHHDGTVTAWGSGQNGMNEVPAVATNVVAIGSGRSHHLAIIGDGSPAFANSLTRWSTEAGSTLRLPAFAVGFQPMSYQWQFNGENIEGQTNTVLDLPNVPLDAAGEYRVVASNAFGSVTGAVTTVSITRAPLMFDLTSEATRVTNRWLKLRLSGLAGSGPAVISVSSNYVDWRPILTNPPSTGTWDFVDPEPATDVFRIYRAEEKEE